jgi:hypothetical protein
MLVAFLIAFTDTGSQLLLLLLLLLLQFFLSQHDRARVKVVDAVYHGKHV